MMKPDWINGYSFVKKYKVIFEICSMILGDFGRKMRAPIGVHVMEEINVAKLQLVRFILKNFKAWHKGVLTCMINYEAMSCLKLSIYYLKAFGILSIS